MSGATLLGKRSGQQPAEGEGCRAPRSVSFRLKRFGGNGQYPPLLFCVPEKTSTIKIFHLARRVFVYSTFDVQMDGWMDKELAYFLLTHEKLKT